jgi:hypothetical protein
LVFGKVKGNYFEGCVDMVASVPVLLVSVADLNPKVFVGSGSESGGEILI